MDTHIHAALLFLMVEFLNSLNLCGTQGILKVLQVIACLGHFVPQCKKFLVGSWRLHGSWTRAELPARALPFTPVIVYALAQLSFQQGWPDLAILLLLGFDRYARTGELFSAKKGDFTWNAAASRLVWSLPLTKGGQRTGAQESLVINDPWLIGALRNFVAPLAPGDLLRSASPGVLRQRLKSLISDLGLPGGFQWYSLRRGGQLRFSSI